VNVTVTWRFVFSACELLHIFVCKEKEPAVIMLKILGVTVRNVAWATRRPGFVQSLRKLRVFYMKMCISLTHTLAKQIASFVQIEKCERKINTNSGIQIEKGPGTSSRTNNNKINKLEV
jgi:hypothetical protein